MVNEWYNRQVDLDAKLSTEIHVYVSCAGQVRGCLKVGMKNWNKGGYLNTSYELYNLDEGLMAIDGQGNSTISIRIASGRLIAREMTGDRRPEYSR